jgi:hypothetical protein
MRSIESLVAGLNALADEDVVELPGADLRDQLGELLVAVHRLNAEVSRRVAAFDERVLAVEDGCRTTAS